VSLFATYVPKPSYRKPLQEGFRKGCIVTTFVVRLTDRKRTIVEIAADDLELSFNGTLTLLDKTCFEQPLTLAAFAPGQWAACYEKETQP